MTTGVYRRPDDYRAKPSPIFMLLAVASATSGVSANTVTATGTLLGTGTLAGTCAVTLTAEVTPLGGNLSGSAASASAGTATLTAIGGIAGTCAIVMDGTASPTGSAGYPTALRQSTVRRWTQPAYDFTAYQNRMTILSLAQEAGITGQCDIICTPTATLRGAGVLAGSSSNVFDGAGILAAAGNLSGSAAIVFTPEGDLGGTASGAITASAAIVMDGSGVMLGDGQLLGIASNSFSASLITGSAQPIAGSCDITLVASGTLESSLPVIIDTPRGRTVLVHNRRRR